MTSPQNFPPRPDSDLVARPPAPTPNPSNPDALLDDLCHLIERTELDLHLTLTVAGQTIAGRLISPSAFVAQIARTANDGILTDPTAIDLRKKLLHQLDVMASDTQALVDERATEPIEDLGWIRFIHLGDANVIGPDGSSHSLGAWRGRLYEVSGWTITQQQTRAHLLA